MLLRVLRAGVGLLLGGSGGLMVAAAWERWAAACPWGEGENSLCSTRQDHRYDFLVPSAPWEPVGQAAELAGWSFLVIALAFVPLPWALTGRRPGPVAAAAWVAAVLALAAAGVATLRSGLGGTIVRPVVDDVTVTVSLLVPPFLLVGLAVSARGWSLAAAISTFLGTPLVAAFSYAVGPYDAQPWWEAVSGVLTATGGLCLLAAAAFSGRSRTRGSALLLGSRAKRPVYADPGGTEPG